MATVTNAAAIVFGTATAVSATDITHYVIKAGSVVLVSDDATGGTPDIQIGTPIRMPAGMLDLGFPAGTDGMTAAGMKAIIDHYFIDSGGPDLEVSLHTGPPGVSGDANEVSVAGYAAVTMAPGAARWTTAA